MDHGHNETWIDAAPHDVYRSLADFRLHPRCRPPLAVEPDRSGRGTRVVRTAAADFRWWILQLLRPIVYRTLVPHMLGHDLQALKATIETDISDNLNDSGAPRDPSNAP